MNDAAHRQPQEFVYLSHPLAVALGEIIVYRDQVDPFAAQSVEVDRHGRHQGLAFTGLHFGDFALVKDNASYQLDVEGPHSQSADRSLPRHRESFGKQIIEFFPVFQSLLEFGGLASELIIAQFLNFRLKAVDFIHNGRKPLQFALIGASEYSF